MGSRVNGRMCVPDGLVMKFYFCQTCGRRVTDADIAEGAARDKALKGVFCVSCAEGISTMNSLPVSNEEARSLLKKEEDAAETRGPRSQARRRESSGSPNVGRPRRKSQKLSGDSGTFSKGGHPIVAAGALVVMLAVGALLLFSRKSSSRPPSRAPGRSAKASTEAPADPADRVRTPSRDHEPSSPGESDGMVEGPVAASKGTASRGPEREPDQAAVKVDARAKPNGEGKLARSAALAPATEKQKQESKEPIPAKKPIPADEASPTKPVPQKKPERVFSSVFVKRVLALLRVGDWKAAETALAQPPARSFPELNEALAGLLANRQKREKALVSAFEKQIGRDITVRTIKGTKTGRLVGMEGKVLRIEKPFKINGEIKGSTTEKVALVALSAAAREALVPSDPPASQKEWVGEFLWRVASKNFLPARKALGHLSDHPLEKPLAGFVAKEETAERKRLAQAAWEALVARAGAKLSKKKAEKLLTELDAFAKDHGKTRFASNKAHRTSWKKVREAVWQRTLGLDPRVIKLFHGRVVDYDADRMKLTVEYDFSVPAQKQDFDGSRWGLDQSAGGWEHRFLKGRILLMAKGRGADLLRMRRFQSSDLRVVLHLHYQRTSKEDPGVGAGLILVGLKGPGSRGKANPVSFVIGVNRHVPMGWHGVPGGRGMKPGFRGPPRECVWEIVSQTPRYVAKCDGKVVAEIACKGKNDHTGFSINAGWDVLVHITRLRVEGRLDPVWLRNALRTLDK